MDNISYKPDYRLYYAHEIICVYLWEGELSQVKAYERTLHYAEGSPLTLRNHFIQPYSVLETLFPEYQRRLDTIEVPLKYFHCA